MDQIKLILNGIVKYSFWIICAVLGIVAIASSILATRSMNEARAKYEREIDSDLSKVAKVKTTVADTGSDAVKAHPNQFTVAGMKEQLAKASAEALKAWEARYSNQSPAYVWPKDLLGPATPAFEVQPIPERLYLTGKPVNPGDAVDSAANDESAAEEVTTINTQSLTKFAEVIHRRLPQITQIIRTKWAFEEESAQESGGDSELSDLGAGLQGRGGKKPDGSADGVVIQKEVVVWRKQDQERWNTLVTSFQEISRLPTNRPTLPMALYIQQDLWLLEALFNVIKDVNGEADAVDNADIKKIDHIFFGRDALGMSGSITPPSGRLLRDAQDQGFKKEVPTVAGASASSAPANKGKFVLKAKGRDFLDGRYVNSNFEPLPAKDVRAAINADTLSSNAELTVAKRIPFRVGFEMDERKIPKFLAACANSPFRFEVRQIRINRHVPGEQPGLDGSSGSAARADAATEGTGGASTGGRGSAKGTEQLIANRTNYTVRVEFFGIVKVYNPVNKKLFELPKELAASTTASK